jgi:hypothetical protein
MLAFLAGACVPEAIDGLARVTMRSHARLALWMSAAAVVVGFVIADWRGGLFLPARDTEGGATNGPGADRRVPLESAGGSAAAPARLSEGTPLLTAEMDFDRLRSEAMQGVARSQWHLAQIYGLCQSYSLDPPRFLASIDAMAGQAPASRAGIERLQRRMADRCSKVDSGEPIPHEAIKGWLEIAAGNGSVAAKISLRVSSLEPLSAQELDDLVGAVARAPDPDAMLELSNLALRPVEGAMSERHAQAVGNPLAGVAWGIAACRIGAACGPGSMAMDSICINSGQCSYASYETFLREELVPPAQVERLDRMVAEVMSLIGRR